MLKKETISVYPSNTGTEQGRLAPSLPGDPPGGTQPPPQSSTHRLAEGSGARVVLEETTVCGVTSQFKDMSLFASMIYLLPHSGVRMATPAMTSSW